MFVLFFSHAEESLGKQEQDLKPFIIHWDEIGKYS